MCCYFIIGGVVGGGGGGGDCRFVDDFLFFNKTYQGSMMDGKSFIVGKKARIDWDDFRASSHVLSNLFPFCDDCLLPGCLGQTFEFQMAQPSTVLFFKQYH